MTEINLAQYYIRKSEIDSALSNSSTNPVQNKVIKNALDTKTTISDVDTEIESYLTNIISQASDYSYILDLVYPIGAIYMSVNNISPATLFGGSWTQLTDTFLYASTTADANATTATAGSKDAVVVGHNHRADMVGTIVKGQSTAWDFTIDSVWNSVGNGGQYENYGQGHIITKNSGESGTDKNMPPYMKVYMWKRTG